jgi:hypothetical protein
MRMLYLPSAVRVSPVTEEILRATVQDTIRIDPHSRTHAIYNALVTERERLLGLLGRLDVRPWRADVRVPGAVEPAHGYEQEVFDADELLYGVPTGYRAESLRVYELDEASTGGVRPEAFDRVIETHEGLVLQAGAALYKLRPGDPVAVELAEGEMGAYRPFTPSFCLVSLAEDRIALYPSQPGRRTPITAELDGLDIVIAEPGRYAVSLAYTRAVQVASVATPDGAAFVLYPSALEDFDRAGRVLDSEGRAVRMEPGTDGAIRVYPRQDGVGSGDAGTFYYQARHTYQVASAPGAVGPVRISFADLAAAMFDYPRRDGLVVHQEADILMRLPGLTVDVPVDTAGLVGTCVLPHTIRAVLPSEFHTLVIGGAGGVDSRITLVEHNIGRARLAADLAGLRLRGVTWTPEGHLGVISARGTTFEVHRLVDVRDVHYQGLRPV